MQWGLMPDTFPVPASRGWLHEQLYPQFSRRRAKTVLVTSSGCACHFTSRDAMTEEELEIADVRNEGDIPAKRSLLS